jgi:hypothetical protein
MTLRVTATVALMLCVGIDARGQTGGTASTGWTVELFGGLALVRRADDGRVTLPPPGAPIQTSGPISPSRETATWFAGDGAALLNSVNAGFGLTDLVTPIDATIARLGRGSPRGVVAGARLRRPLGRRLDLELGVELGRATNALGADVRGAAEETRASYERAWRALFSTGPLSDVVVEATAEVAGGARRDVAATAAINWWFGGTRDSGQYLTGGGGVLASAGDATAVVLEGRYEFAVALQGERVAFSESDRLTLRVGSARTFVAVAGGGIRRPLGSRWRLQIDARVTIGEHGASVRLDADPSVVTSTPAGVIEAGGIGPTIQFSNNPSTNRRSSLSAAPLGGFEVYAGSGLQVRTTITVGFVVGL